MDYVDNRTGIFHTINGETREIVVELRDPRQLDIWSDWPLEKRLRFAAEHARAALRMIRAQLEDLHPEWSEAEIRREVARRTLAGT